MNKSILTALLLVITLGAYSQKTINDSWTFEGQPVNIPHTWNTDAYTVKDYSKGTFTYERAIFLKKDGKRKYIRFDAAFKVADVWFNDVYMGQHKGGYTAFAFDVTPHVKDGLNKIRVKVSNLDETVPPISADFTFMGGIYRDVWLIEKAEQHFDVTDGLRVTADATKVNVSCNLQNHSGKNSECLLTSILFDANGKQLRKVSTKVKLNDGQKKVNQSVQLPANPKLWTPETPYLYRLQTTLQTKDGKTILDRQERPVAVRWYSFDANNGFTLNGKPYKLHGVCIHQDQEPYGIALDDDQHRRDFRLMKEMGVNFVRLAHYPQDDAILDMCDREGMFVWEEIPVVDIVPEGEDFSTNCQQQLREMIGQHASHPSVILWGYMNEILLQTLRQYKGAALDTVITRTVDLTKKLEQIVHEEDPSRTSVMACHGSNQYNTTGLTGIPQVIGWNLYQGWYGSNMAEFERRLEKEHKENPTHPIIVSEYGAGSDLRLHNPAGGKAFDFSMEYQQKYIEHYIPVIENTPYVCGGAYWNFIDFASAKRDESMPRINNKGLVTANRTPKDVFYYIQACWTEKPVTHIAVRDWQIRNTANATTTIKVYTNQKEVELIHNGKSLGTQQADNNTALFNITMTPGKNHLRAITKGYEDAADIVYQPVDINELAVNVGSDCHYQSAKSGKTWLPDQPYSAENGWGYIGGEASQTQTEVTQTADNPLYQTMRKGIEAYRFDVPKGRYEVEVLFTNTNKATESLAYLLGRDQDNATQNDSADGFAIEINGETIDNISPTLPFSAIKRRYVIENYDDCITIGFSGNATISAVSIARQ